ncbi:hypothetical protein GYMLUDRAFT_939250 [Collybiopsis luxurians FD-317 M1]|uniref:Uncharacterized protein n=1 Tax=Collybiopsis luxurians FD-317 M1 TaxID=944289 RepID=A0A0D0BFG0_9AGAR|nr:hypothetical protein GYMLUDRAFT_939250 [Collybiopsis luxurians FD-317 M1]
MSTVAAMAEVAVVVMSSFPLLILCIRVRRRLYFQIPVDEAQSQSRQKNHRHCKHDDSQPYLRVGRRYPISARLVLLPDVRGRPVRPGG